MTPISSMAGLLERRLHASQPMAARDLDKAPMVGLGDAPFSLTVDPHNPDHVFCHNLVLVCV